jgi:hypothetical protein
MRIFPSLLHQPVYVLNLPRTKACETAFIGLRTSDSKKFVRDDRRRHGIPRIAIACRYRLVRRLFKRSVSACGCGAALCCDMTGSELTGRP